MLDSASKTFFHLLNEYGLLKPLSPILSQMGEGGKRTTTEKSGECVEQTPYARIAQKSRSVS